jgi:transglutaminase superfamily protein
MLMSMVACLSFLWLAGTWAFLSVPLTIAIAASWFVPQRYSTTPRRQRILFSVIGLPFLFLGLYNFTLGGVTGFQRIAVLGAVYVLLGAVLELYRCPEEARPAVFHAGLVTVMLVGGLNRSNPFYLTCLFLYTLGLVGLLNQPVSGMVGGPKTRERTAPVAVLAVGLILAIPLANFYNSLVPGITRTLYNSYAATLTGSSQVALLYRFATDLSTIQDLRGSEEISARVFGPPTLLRGQVFFQYKGGQWSGIKARDKREILTSKVGRFSLADKDDVQGLTSWRIEPVKLFAGPLSVPAGTVEVVASFDELEVDPFDGLVADNTKPFQVLATGRPGAGYSTRRPAVNSAEWDSYYLQIPEDLDTPLREIAERVVGEKRPSARDAAIRLEAYLIENGSYSPGAVHSRRAPILHFLGDGKLAGHCEYFATSLTLLLRSLDIPARYVLGYVASERNPWGDYLIVRDRDAHAWVEVYFDGQWHIFDPTPTAEMLEAHPEGFRTPTLDAIWDYLSYLSSGFWRWISNLEGKSLESKFLVSIGGFFLLAILLALYRFRHSLAGLRSRNRKEEPLQRLGHLFFARVSRQGLRKHSAETPLEFSRRVLEECGPESAEWLEDYVVLRFRGADEGQVEKLAKRLEGLREI